MAGAALGALQGVGCTPWRPLVSGGFCVAGAALGALQGVRCTLWRPLVSAGCCVANGKGSDVGCLRCSAGGFCMAGAALGAPQGVGCTPWRPLVSAALPVAFAWQAQHLVLCKGSDVRSSVPWSPVAFAWQARHLVLCKRLDVRPGVPWSPLLCRWLLRGRRSTWCSARGRMYALASLGLRCSAGGFCVAGAALGALQWVGCTPWRPLVSGGFCVAGAALGALQGVRCTPWRPLVSAGCCVANGKGSDVRPGIPWSPLLCRWLLRGRHSTWCSARGWMYALASLGLRCSAGGFCVSGAALGGVQGVGCTPWRPLVSGGFCVAGAAFGALQEVGCTQWRPLVSAALPVAFAWQAQHLVLCKGSDVRPGVPWSPLLCRWLFLPMLVRCPCCSLSGLIVCLCCHVNAQPLPAVHGGALQQTNWRLPVQETVAHLLVLKTCYSRRLNQASFI